MVDLLLDFFNPSPSQYSIAALLDTEHDALVREIWRELKADFGVQVPFLNPVPHITHVQAGSVNQDEMHAALRHVAKVQHPYIVRTAGLGLFTGERNALYVPVVRNPTLTSVHMKVIEALKRSIDDIAGTHRVETWIPHITLAMGLSSKDVDTLAALVKHLAARSFTWEFEIRQFALLDGDPSDEQAPFTVTLGG